MRQRVGCNGVHLNVVSLLLWALSVTLKSRAVLWWGHQKQRGQGGRFHLSFFTIYLFLAGSSLLHMSFLRCSARASPCSGFSCEAQALDARASVVWHTGLVAPWHVGSSRTKDRTHVSWIARRILNHWTTRKVHLLCLNLLPHVYKLQVHQGSTFLGSVRTGSQV